ncbi:hypothetical protein CYMTET_4551 [Cymbomonas tetramitiformis]|uniref:Uncharacterized protein n=1 Tax=Cymbomonas tetramitiformis TaxID=36881 RepID=A0AAE0LJX9_9CHLO|nr:hypothetical protein CYMTET_4551 [Cymbomonas tetramitiformis]
MTTIKSRKSVAARAVHKAETGGTVHASIDHPATGVFQTTFFHVCRNQQSEEPVPADLDYLSRLTKRGVLSLYAYTFALKIFDAGLKRRTALLGLALSLPLSNNCSIAAENENNDDDDDDDGGYAGDVKLPEFDDKGKVISNEEIKPFVTHLGQ